MPKGKKKKKKGILTKSFGLALVAGERDEEISLGGLLTPLLVLVGAGFGGSAVCLVAGCGVPEADAATPLLPPFAETDFLLAVARTLGVSGKEAWSFCLCRRSKSRRAKQRSHTGHWKGFSLVWERSWRLRCSSRANERVHVRHMWGLGLSVLMMVDLGGICWVGCGILGPAGGWCWVFLPWEGTAWARVMMLLSFVTFMTEPCNSRNVWRLDRQVLGRYKNVKPKKVQAKPVGGGKGWRWRWNKNV